MNGTLRKYSTSPTADNGVKGTTVVEPIQKKKKKHNPGCGVTLLFDHTPNQMSEIEHFEIFSHLQKNQLAQQFFVNLICYCSFSFPNVLIVLCIYGGI